MAPRATAPSARHDVAATAPPLSIRFAARAIDGLVLAALGIAIGIPMGFGIAWLVTVAVLVFTYFVVLDATWTTTVGKRVVGIEVADASGGRPSLGSAVAREAFVLVGAVPFAGPVLALAAWISIALSVRADPSGRGWHDRIAGGVRVVWRRAGSGGEGVQSGDM